MRKIIMTLSIALVSACGVESAPSSSADSTDESSVEQGVCEDAWECWCNTFSTKSACNAAVSGGRHCYWAGASATASASVASLGLCHATYE
jgi:hypothetical protein